MANHFGDLVFMTRNLHLIFFAHPSNKVFSSAHLNAIFMNENMKKWWNISLKALSPLNLIVWPINMSCTYLCSHTCCTHKSTKSRKKSFLRFEWMFFHDMVDMPAPFNQLTSWQTKFKFKLNFPTTFAGNFQTLFFRLANIKRTKCAIFCLKPRNCFFSTFSNLNFS